MFNLFKSKNNTPKVSDTIWMTQVAKWNGISEVFKKDPSLVIICWFNATLRELESLFTNQSPALLLASQAHISQVAGRPVIFAEHHPLHTKEQELFTSLGLTEVIVYSSLEESLFDRFNGDRIIQMMKQLGMKETESVSHKMVSQAIVNAQEKIEKKVATEHLANSQGEWLERNLE